MEKNTTVFDQFKRAERTRQQWARKALENGGFVKCAPVPDDKYHNVSSFVRKRDKKYKSRVRIVVESDHSPDPDYYGDATVLNGYEKPRHMGGTVGETLFVGFPVGIKDASRGTIEKHVQDAITRRGRYLASHDSKEMMFIDHTTLP